MNILFLSAYYPPRTRGGAEVSTHLIARGLVAKGHNVTVMTEGDQREEGMVDGVKVLRFPLGLQKKPLFEEAAARRLSALLAREITSRGPFDIIHAHDFRSALALSELRYPKTVVTVRDYAPISGCTNNITAKGSTDPGCGGDEWHCHRVAEASFPRNLFRAWQYMYNKEYRRKAFSLFSRQIFISHAEEAVIRKHLPLSQVTSTVIYNPIAPEYLSTPPVLKTSRTIVYVGRVEMYKGVDTLLSAWRSIFQKMPGWKLIIAGDGAQRVQYERMVSQWGLQYQVSFKPHIPNEKMLSVYDDADIVVAPHRWVEPFGRTVVEAMSRGRIVVTSASGGPGEIITHGKTGFTSVPGDSSALADALVQAAGINHYDRRDIQKTARTWVAEHLNIDEIARQHEEFYKTV